MIDPFQGVIMHHGLRKAIVFLGYVCGRLAGEVDQLRPPTRAPVSEVLEELGNVISVIVQEPRRKLPWGSRTYGEPKS